MKKGDRNFTPHVFMTQDTMRGIMLEKVRHPGLECIVQIPGRRIGDDFYFDMVSDSGPHATYQVAMCEKDHEYADHLSSMLLQYYDFPKKELTLSQIHFHPAACKRFSHGDGPANLANARQFGGVVNGLMWADPQFHIQFWYIDETGKETPAEYTIDDEAVAEAMPRKSLEMLKRQIEENEAGGIARKGYVGIAAMGTAAARDAATGNEEARDAMAKTAAESTKIKGKKVLFFKKNEKKAGEAANMRKGKKMETKRDMEVEMSFEEICKARRPIRVLLPKEYRTIKYEGPLYGYYIPNTKTFNVVTENSVRIRDDVKVIGRAFVKKQNENQKEEHKDPFVEVTWTNQDPVVTVAGNEEAEIVIDYISTKEDCFSRNTGLVAVDKMGQAQAVIIGCGSGGSIIAQELAKAGCGSLVLIDSDVLEYHNISRHVAGIHDVGRFKTDVMKERISDINPNAQVYTFADQIQNIDPEELEKVIWKNSVIICGTDNRHAAYFAQKLADQYQIPMINPGCGPMGSTGEVFYYKPGMPCYTCAYGKDVGVDYSNQPVRRRFYATERELEKMHFQPGMSLDITLTAIFAAKLAIDLLMEGEEGYEPKLLPYVKQVSILLNFPVSEEVNPYMKLFKSSGQLPMTWKTGSVVKNENCSYCGKKS